MTPMDLEAFIIVLVGANPFPDKNVTGECAYGAIVRTDPNGPVGFPDGFEMQRRMECVGRPNAIVLARKHSRANW